MDSPEDDLAPPWPVGQPDNIPPLPRSMRRLATLLLQRMVVVTDQSLRVRLVVEALREVTREEAATLIAELRRAAAGHPAGQVTLLALSMALSDPEALPPEVLATILAEAQQRGDVAVSGLLREQGSWQRQRGKLPPPPPGSPSRELSLGERRSLARRPDRHSLEKLLLDPEPMVIRNLLPNSRLTEDDVLRIASRRPARPEVLAEVQRCPRWVCRPRIQLALVLNPYHATELSLRLVELLPRAQLKVVAQQGAIDPTIRRAAQQALARGEIPGSPVG